MNKKEKYTPPRIDVYSFKEEKGYAASGFSSVPLFLVLDEYQRRDTETFSTHSTWGAGESDDFWNN